MAPSGITALTVADDGGRIGIVIEADLDVHDGAVAISDEFDNPTDRHVAAVLAEAVSGSDRGARGQSSHAATDENRQPHR